MNLVLLTLPWNSLLFCMDAFEKRHTNILMTINKRLANICLDIVIIERQNRK